MIAIVPYLASPLDGSLTGAKEIGRRWSPPGLPEALTSDKDIMSLDSWTCKALVFYPV
jgi:hypothetical protein